MNDCRLVGQDAILPRQVSNLPHENNGNTIMTSVTRTRFASVVLLSLILATSLRQAKAAEKQASELRARHVAGQTFLTWKETAPPTAAESLAMPQLRRLVEESAKKVRYRLYRSERPITSLDGLKPIAEVPSLTCWNLDYNGGDDRPEQQALRYVVEEGKPPLPPGTGIYVHNPRLAGEAYYAVTCVDRERESRSLTAENTTSRPVRETVGQGLPVLQRVEHPKEFQYVSGGPTLRYYVRWESPPNCAIAGKPYDYLVAIPPKPRKPAPVGIHLHCWGGSLNGGYGWWYNAEEGHFLLASNQVPYDWWTGYHERYWQGPRDQKAWQGGMVHPYSQRRLFSFLDWMTTQWEIDLPRTHVAGSSMGGSGSPMLAIRYPERIAWAVSWVGVHIPAQSPQFKGSYANVFGEPEWNVRFDDGTPVWDYFNDARYLREHPEKEVGLILFSNGKNDAAIGWPQAAEFHRALQETHRPHVFVWGQSGHGQRALMPVTLEERILPIDVRTDRSLPAFSRCSLDDRPGRGAADDGDPKGQSNLYLFWETKDAVDRPDAWEMTVGLIDKAPKDTCTVDITPRRLQAFKPRPDQAVRWTNRAADGSVVQSGAVKADAHGLVTLPDVRVGKGKNRIRIER
jgi:pimeloyl-ACP methyl ester carboxylesterase